MRNIIEATKDGIGYHGYCCVLFLLFKQNMQISLHLTDVFSIYFS